MDVSLAVGRLTNWSVASSSGCTNLWAWAMATCSWAARSARVARTARKVLATLAAINRSANAVAVARAARCFPAILRTSEFTESADRLE